MGSVLQFAAFLSICWLIRGVVTHPNQDDGKQLNNKHSNQNGNGDFYFEEQKTNNDNVKSGRSIPQSAWSKEDKEQIQQVERKAGAQFNDEFSFKSALSYLLNMIHELKQDIFGIKELTSLKNAMGGTNSKDKVKQNKENNGSPNSDDSTINTEFEKENRKLKSSYIIDYYQKNGIKFVDDDLETSSDESDDSSHKPNEGGSMHEDSKNKDNPCISECLENKRKTDKYSSGAEEITTIPTRQTKVPQERFDDIKESEKYYDFKESTAKPSKMKPSKSKAIREKTENNPSSLTGRCMKKKIDNSNNLNKKNEPSEKPLKSADVVTTKSPQNENFNKAKSGRFNQNEITDNPSKGTSPSPASKSSGKNSQNEGGSNFDSKSGILDLSTTLTSQGPEDAFHPDNMETKPPASRMSSEKPTNKKELEQITSLKPEEQEQTPNKAAPLQNNDRENEYTTISLPLNEARSENPNHEQSSALESKSPEESKSRVLNVNSNTTVTYSENESNSKIDGQQTSNSFDNSYTISPTTPGNIMNTDNLNEDPSVKLNSKRGPNENEKSETTQQGKNDSVTENNNEAGQKQTQQLSDNSESRNSLENKKLKDSNPENNDKEEDGNLSSKTTNSLASPQDSNGENQNIEKSDKPQEAQKNKESINEKDGMAEISPDQEEEDDEDEDFDVSDEFTDTEADGDFDQNEGSEFMLNNGNEGNDDEYPGNTATVFRNESQIYQPQEEKSEEQYNTFLEYFYKHSNNSLFESLKNQSYNFSQ